MHYTSLTEEVGCERRVHLLALDGAAGVAVLAVLLARRRRLPDDPLHLLELLRVHVTVAVQVEHPERDLELPPDEVDESDVRIETIETILAGTFAQQLVLLRKLGRHGLQGQATPLADNKWAVPLLHVTFNLLSIEIDRSAAGQFVCSNRHGFV